MARPTIENEKMDASVLVRMTPEQRDAMKEAASLDDKPLGRWLRDLGIGRAKRLAKK